ncbi:MAG: ABC transporter substrate-binding protein [Xanthobacteraceae bacterium]
MMPSRRRARGAIISRRTVIALGAGTMLGSPFAAFAQPNAAPVIGLLDAAASTADQLAAFYDGLKAEGYIRNQTIAALYHSAAGDYSRLPALAADLVKRQVTAIAAFGVPAALAARDATTAIPVVFAIGPSPVEIGLVRSLDLPGGNITGVTALSAGRERKRLDFLHELIPATKEIALLINPADANAGTRIQEVVAAARTMSLRLRPIRASAASEFDAAFDSLAASPPGGLVIADDEFFDSRAADLGFLALRRRIPAIFQGRSFAAAGGLISYGSNLGEIYHQVGAYAGLILKGANAATLPIYQSVKVDFIVNARTAAFFGIPLPAAILSAANEIMK